MLPAAAYVQLLRAVALVREIGNERRHRLAQLVVIVAEVTDVPKAREEILEVGVPQADDRL